MALEDKKIFLTGGAGFIGSRLVEKLASHNKITIYDNFSRDSITDKGLLDHPNVTCVRGDIRDFESLKQAMRGAEYIVHMAAIAGVDTVIKDPVTTMQINIIGTYNVLEAAKDLPNLQRLLEFSTSEVFGTYAFKVDEKATTTQGSVGEARWTYAVSKLSGEHMSHAYYAKYNLPVVTLRPFNVYGPGQIGEGAIHHFIKRAVFNEDIVVHGDGSQIRAWCYIDDMVKGVLLALEKPEAIGESFNIGNPRSSVTIYDLAERSIRLTNSYSKIQFKAITYTDVEIRIPNIDKARQLLGYEPEIDLDEGLIKTAEWYRKALTLCAS